MPCSKESNGIMSIVESFFVNLTSAITVFDEGKSVSKELNKDTHTLEFKIVLGFRVLFKARR